MEGDKRISKSRFMQIPIVNVLYKEEEVLGVVHAPFKDDMSASFLIIRRDNELIRVRYPLRINYSDLHKERDGGKNTLKSLGFSSTDQHQQNYHDVIKAFVKAEQLAIGA